jgi:protocatechuate 3,4-dioxygenase beta subunit
MKNDDEQVGRILSRREALKLLGVTGLAALVGCTPELSSAPTSAAPTSASILPSATSADPTQALVEATAASPTGFPACVVRPALTEGPYFVDERLDRRDIRSDPGSGEVKEGAPLILIFNVSQIRAEGCQALAGAYVDVWHCDALGMYSDVADPSFNSVGQAFLRGYQQTDDQGQAQFLTIYPGWYRGRAVHIHFKIRSALDAPGYEFTSQLFFDEGFTDQVYLQEPYAGTGQRTILNEQDGIFQQSNGQLTLETVETSDGYAASFDIGLDL